MGVPDEGQGVGWSTQGFVSGGPEPGTSRPPRLCAPEPVGRTLPESLMVTATWIQKLLEPEARAPVSTVLVPQFSLQHWFTGGLAPGRSPPCVPRGTEPKAVFSIPTCSTWPRV